MIEAQKGLLTFFWRTFQIVLNYLLEPFFTLPKIQRTPTDEPPSSSTF
jgi:hypothetical protein